MRAESLQGLGLFLMGVSVGVLTCWAASTWATRKRWRRLAKLVGCTERWQARLRFANPAQAGTVGAIEGHALGAGRALVGLHDARVARATGDRELFLVTLRVYVAWWRLRRLSAKRWAELELALEDVTPVHARLRVERVLTWREVSRG